MTPADVVASFERVLTHTAAELAQGSLPELVGASSCSPDDPASCDLSRAVVADDAARTVTFHLSRRAPDFLSILASGFFTILLTDTPIELDGTLPRAQARTRSPRSPTTGPPCSSATPSSGNGPRRPSRPRSPTASRSPPGSRPRASGDGRGREADLTGDFVPSDLVEELQRRASDQLVRSQFLALFSVTLNTASPPFDDADARRAVAYALDRGDLARLLTEITGRSEFPVSCQVIPPNIPGYAPYCPFSGPGAETEGSWAGPDLSEARDLVRRSGTSGAQVVVAVAPFFEAVGERMVGTLRDLGYRARLTVVKTEVAVLSPHDAARRRRLVVGVDADLPVGGGVPRPLARMHRGRRHADRRGRRAVLVQPVELLRPGDRPPDAARSTASSPTPTVPLADSLRSTGTWSIWRR